MALKQLTIIALLTLALTACDKPKEETTQVTQAAAQCAKDTDCKGERICEAGQCVNPTPQSPLATRPEPIAVAEVPAPAVAYEAILVSGKEAGPFTVTPIDGGNAINYQSRAGVMNLLESVVDYPDGTGYVVIEKAYAFGPNKYVLVVSTGESGNSCPATTYVLSFDTKSEFVDGKASIDGCSEEVESFADGNKLSIKKDGETTVVYNGTVK
jgi:hypothetical protein